MQDVSSLKERARGRWPNILAELGLGAILGGNHMPCPKCGGKDRFRFTDYKNDGGYICGQCGTGDGIDLVRKALDIPFAQAMTRIEQTLTSCAPRPVISRGRDPRRVMQYRETTWASGRRLTGHCLGSVYLISRGLDFVATERPCSLRYAEKVKHTDEGKDLHCLMGYFMSPDRSAYTLHFTFIDPDGSKAAIEKPKKLAFGTIPQGGAIRLAQSGEVLGIAEGIETALAAHKLFGVPVWAATSAHQLMKFEPPQSVKHLIVFGDHDANAVGHVAAYTLKQRMVTERGIKVDVEIPRSVGDWLDVYTDH